MLIVSPDVLAVYLKDYRRRHKLTQTAIAERMGLRQATISAFEKKPEKANVETLFRIITALQLELHLLPRPTLSDKGDSW